MKKNKVASKKPEIENNKKRHGAAIIAASLAALWIIFELAVFFVSMPSAPEIDFYESCTTKPGENGYEITALSTIKMSGAVGAIQTISFDVIKTKDSVLADLPAVKVLGTDPAVSGRVTYASEDICIGDEKKIKTVLKLDVPKNASDIAITFNHEGCDYYVSNIRINAKNDVSFNFGRCAIVLGIILIFWLCAHFGLWRIFFDGEKHGMYALAVCLVCVILTLFLTSVLLPERSSTKYPLEHGVNAYNPYVQQFDALKKGQLHIDYPVSEELLALENPYDYGARQGMYYLWDRAMYDGKYYSYFGMAPIFTVYAPYQALTGNLPSDDTVSAIFTLLTSLFFSMAAVKWAAMRTKKVPLPLIMIGTLGALFSTQAFLMARGYSRFYYIATISGIAFLSMFIWLFLCGISGSFRLRSPEGEPRAWVKPLSFVLAGTAFGLCFLSRFNIALVAAFAIVPMLWFFIVTKKNEEGKHRLRPLKRIIPELLALAFPVIIAVVFQLWLNVTRFDSLFEFGTSYQLTVSDVSLNRLRLSDLPAAIFHYFIHPIMPGLNPPFMSLYYTSLNNYGHYVYVDTGMGLFAIPLMWALLGSIGIFASKKRGIESKLTLASILVGLVTVALLDFCLGGVIFRYTCDLTVVGAFASMAIVYALYESFTSSGSETVAVAANTVTAAFFILSFLVSISLAFSDNANLTPYAPEFCSFFRSLFGA